MYEPGLKPRSAGGKPSAKASEPPSPPYCAERTNRLCQNALQVLLSTFGSSFPSFQVSASWSEHGSYPPPFIYLPTTTLPFPLRASEYRVHRRSSKHTLSLKLPRPCEPKHPQALTGMPDCPGMQAMCPPYVEQSPQSQPAVTSMSKSPEGKTS
jgi:hypothetical protein